MPNQSHNIWQGVQMKLLIMQFSAPTCYFHTLLGLNIPVCTLFSDMLIVCLPLIWEIKTKGRIIVFYVLIFCVFG